jgi:hypothetical protein
MTAPKSDLGRQVVAVDDAVAVFKWGKGELLRLADELRPRYAPPADATAARRAELEAGFRAELLLRSKAIEARMAEKFALLTQPLAQGEKCLAGAAAVAAWKRVLGDA